MKSSLKEKLIKCSLGVVSLVVPIIFIVILLHVFLAAIPALSQLGLGLLDPDSVWRPRGIVPSFSILPMILATLYVSVLAVVIAAPIACLCAVFINFYLDKKSSGILLAFVDMLAGVPSVILGFIGLVVLVSSFERIFDMSAGQSILAASFILAIILLPFIVSSYSESIAIAKARYGAASVALGTSKEFVILQVILPATRRSAATAITAAFGRAMGETMAVMMVIGNSPIFPRLFGRGLTIPGLTALEFGSAELGSMHLSAIYAANVILLVLICLIFTATYFLKKGLLKEHEKI